MKFRQIVEEKGFTGYKLSKKSGVYQSMIGRYMIDERNIVNASFSTVIKICDSLELSLDEFRKLLEE